MQPSVLTSSVQVCKKALLRNSFDPAKCQFSGVHVVIHTRAVETYDENFQRGVKESLTIVEDVGIRIHTHKKLQEHYAVIDERIVWYGNVDFLTFSHMDMDVLRFLSIDIASEPCACFDEAGSEQLMISDLPT